MSPGLTPVRIRGKRKTPSTKPPAALRQHQEQEKEQQQPSKKPKRSISTVMATRASRARPNLDTLPSEILETILLYSTNLSLPNCTPLIGLKLSERATLLRFFIWAFHETWLQSFLHGRPAKDRPQTQIHGDCTLQAAVLKQPWATIDFILQAEQTWADKHASARRESRFDARKSFEDDFQKTLKWCPIQVESMRWDGEDINPTTRIPEALITGPWSEEQQRRLYWLARGGMLVGPPDSDSETMLPWETKMEFLRNAVINAAEPNMMAINCLMGAWVFQHLPGDVVRKELGNIDLRVKWGDDTDGTRYILQRTRDALDMFLDYRQI